MTDKWMNIGYENEELKPHIEPKPDLNDSKRIGKNHFFCFSHKQVLF